MPSPQSIDVNHDSFFSHLCKGLQDHLKDLRGLSSSHEEYYAYPSLANFKRYQITDSADTFSCGFIGSGPIAVAEVLWLINEISERNNDQHLKAVQPSFLLLDGRHGFSARGHGKNDDGREIIQIGDSPIQQDQLPVWFLNLKAFGAHRTHFVTFHQALEEGIQYHLLHAQMVFQLARVVFHFCGSMIHFQHTKENIMPHQDKDAWHLVNEHRSLHSCSSGIIPVVKHVFVAPGKDRNSQSKLVGDDSTQMPRSGEKEDHILGKFIAPNNVKVLLKRVTTTLFDLPMEIPDQRFNALMQPEIHPLAKQNHMQWLPYEQTALFFPLSPLTVTYFDRGRADEEVKRTQIATFLLTSIAPKDSSLQSLLDSKDTILREQAISVIATVKACEVMFGYKPIHGTSMHGSRVKKTHMTWEQLLQLKARYNHTEDDRWKNLYKATTDGRTIFLLGDALDSVSGSVFYSNMRNCADIARVMFTREFERWEKAFLLKIEYVLADKTQKSATHRPSFNGLRERLRENAEYKKMIDDFYLPAKASTAELKIAFEKSVTGISSFLEKEWVEAAWKAALTASSKSKPFNDQDMVGLAPYHHSFPLDLSPTDAQRYFDMVAMNAALDKRWPGSSYKSKYDHPFNVKTRADQELVRKAMIKAGAANLGAFTYAEVEL